MQVIDKRAVASHYSNCCSYGCCGRAGLACLSLICGQSSAFDGLTSLAKLRALSAPRKGLVQDTSLCRKSSWISPSCAKTFALSIYRWRKTDLLKMLCLRLPTCTSCCPCKLLQNSCIYPRYCLIYLFRPYIHVCSCCAVGSIVTASAFLMYRT